VEGIGSGGNKKSRRSVIKLVALKSQFIISGDRALQEIENYMGIKIGSPKQLPGGFNV
jgi:hypothetical protein